MLVSVWRRRGRLSTSWAADADFDVGGSAGTPLRPGICNSFRREKVTRSFANAAGGIDRKASRVTTTHTTYCILDTIASYCKPVDLVPPPRTVCALSPPGQCRLSSQ